MSYLVFVADTPPRSIPHNGDTTGTPGVLLHSILHPTPMKQGGSDQNRVSPPKDKENDVGEEQQSTSSRTLTTRSMSRTQKKRKVCVCVCVLIVLSYVYSCLCVCVCVCVRVCVC